MSITVIGIGYVGLVAAACFAEMGNTVMCVDSNEKKITDLKAGRIPIHEPGLDEFVLRNLHEGRLKFTALLHEVAPSDIYFIAVGTPPSDDGSADLVQVLEVARQLGRVLRGYAIVVNKSTVPVGTADRVRQTIQDEIDARGSQRRDARRVEPDPHDERPADQRENGRDETRRQHLGHYR